MQVVVDNLITNCELSGKGKLVLLLHGWGDSLRGLAPLQSELSKHYRVLSVDLPGFGNTEAPPAVWGLDEYGRFLAALLRKLELDELYALIGHSNGGAIAIRAIAREVLSPKKLVLLAASGIRSDQSARRFAFQVIAKTGNVATAWLPNRYRDALRRNLYGAAGSDLFVMPQLQETFKKTVRQDVQADAHTLKLPVLLVYAADDETVPLKHGEKYHHLIVGSTLKVVQTGGHFLHQQQLPVVADSIEGFLK